jgi:hypothetical protein
VLAYGPLVTGGSDSKGEASATYLPAGSIVTVADEGLWKSYATADFAKYHLIIAGEGGVCPASTSYQTLYDTRSIWGAAVKGRIVITEQDPVYHSGFGSSTGAGTFLRASLLWAAGGPGTGMYVGADCDVRHLDFMTVFGAINTIDGSTGGDDVHIVAPSHAIMVGSTDASLSSWGSSYHGEIITIPADFVVVTTTSSDSSKFITVARDKLCGP